MLTKLYKDYYAKYLLTIFVIVGGYLALVVTDSYSNHQHIATCPFKLLTGIPCAGCGMGRATLEIMRGNIIASFQYNILCIPFTLAIITSLVWLVTDLAKNKETFFSFIKRDIATPYKLLLFMLVGIAWAVNIVRQV